MNIERVSDTLTICTDPARPGWSARLHYIFHTWFVCLQNIDSRTRFDVRNRDAGGGYLSALAIAQEMLAGAETEVHAARLIAARAMGKDGP
jgi:hypothetical protein